MDKLAFESKLVRQHGRVYTTLSHVKYIKSLYSLNKLEHINFSLSDKVVVELQRLRESASCQLEYDLYSIETNDC